MRDPDFTRLAGRLRRAGVAQRYVERSIEELGEHYDALTAELTGAGYRDEEARRLAAERLGDLSLIGNRIAARPELKCWYYRWPGVARIALPVASCAVLPVVAGVQHAAVLVRWSCCMLLAGLVTFLLFGIMQLTMQLG